MNQDGNDPQPGAPNPALPSAGPDAGAPSAPSSTATPARTNAVGPSVPTRGLPPRRPDSKQSPVFGCFFAVSVLLNIAAVLVLVLVCGFGYITWRMGGTGDESILAEKYVSGNATAKDKIAILQLDGIIMEGSLSYVHKQIEQAGKDKGVKAIVLRINSPGGSITASDDLHRRLTELVKGSAAKKYDARPMVVSMGSLAASEATTSPCPARSSMPRRPR
jgi:hypothetical protein